MLLLSYQGQKPLSPEVHTALAAWVKQGGKLVVVDGDHDPYNQVREWWNDDGKNDRIPRQHLFETLGLKKDLIDGPSFFRVGKGALYWLQSDPTDFARDEASEGRFIFNIQGLPRLDNLTWKETNYLSLRRGPYVVGAGLDESVAGEPKALQGRFVNLFDPELRVQTSVALTPGSRVFLLDLDATKPTETPRVLASACKALPGRMDEHSAAWTVEGVGDTPAIVLIACAKAPKSLRLDGKGLDSFTYQADDGLLYVRFPNEARPRELSMDF